MNTSKTEDILFSHKKYKFTRYHNRDRRKNNWQGEIPWLYITLNWSEHIKHIENNISPKFGAKSGCRDYVRTNIMLLSNLQCIFLSIFRYLIPLWGTCVKPIFKQIETLQNNDVKALSKFQYTTSTHIIYDQTNKLCM